MLMPSSSPAPKLLLLKKLSSLLLLRFLSSSPQNPKTLQKTLDQISHSFAQGSPPDRIPLSDLLRPDHAESVLHRLRSRPDSAIRFFQWSEEFLGFSHTLPSFCAVAHVLLSRRMFDPARWVLDRMIRRFSASDAFIGFSRGFQVYGSNPSTVYSLLVDCYCRAGMVDGSVEVFRRMCEMGVSVSSIKTQSFRV
ncbi:hypothetical protein AAC387_Pa01g4201 [Persea americana]